MDPRTHRNGGAIGKDESRCSLNGSWSGSPEAKRPQVGQKRLARGGGSRRPRPPIIPARRTDVRRRSQIPDSSERILAIKGGHSHEDLDRRGVGYRRFLRRSRPGRCSAGPTTGAGRRSEVTSDRTLAWAVATPRPTGDSEVGVGPGTAMAHRTAASPGDCPPGRGSTGTLRHPAERSVRAPAVRTLEYGRWDDSAPSGAPGRGCDGGATRYSHQFPATSAWHDRRTMGKGSR